MKKIIFALAVVFIAAPAWATVEITVVDEGDGVGAIYYDASTALNLVRTFALDIVVSDGNIIVVDDTVNDDYVIYPGSIQIDGSRNVTYAGTYSEEAPQLLGSDPCAANSPQTADVNLDTECLPSSHPDYYEWLSVGSPECWCNPRQCHGDADGRTTKCSYWVATDDLDILVAAWAKPYPAAQGGIEGQQLYGVDLICADFDHAAQGKNNYRVATNDLDILVANWAIPNGPAPDCP